MDKVNRLKVNSSSCAWATRGTQLGWRRQILAEGAMNHLIYVADTLINLVKSQSHNQFQIITIYIFQVFLQVPVLHV